MLRQKPQILIADRKHESEDIGSFMACRKRGMERGPQCGDGVLIDLFVVGVD